MNKKTERTLKELGKRLDQSNKAITNAKHASKLIPFIEKDREYIKWQINALRKMPEEMKLSNDYIRLTKTENRTFRTIYKPLIDNKIGDIPEILTTTSGSGATYAIAYAVSNNQQLPQNYGTWAHNSMKKYNLLAQKYKLQQDLKNLINRLNPDLAGEFEQAINDLAKIPSGIIKISDLAFRFRTIMEKIKGDLKTIIIQEQVKGNKIFDELAYNFTGKNGGDDQKLFENEVGIYNDLHNEFSDIGKLNKMSNALDFQSLAIRFENNLYSILSILLRNNIKAF